MCFDLVISVEILPCNCQADSSVHEFFCHIYSHLYFWFHIELPLSSSSYALLSSDKFLLSLILNIVK